MVDWKAVLSGKTMGDVENLLSRLTDAQQQQALQLLGHQIAPPIAPVYKLVILNNKSRGINPITYAWHMNWPHQLAWERPAGNAGDNTLVLAKNILTLLRIGLLPLGPNPGPNQPDESVTISLHRADTENRADTLITAAQLTQAPAADGSRWLPPNWLNGKPIFVKKSPSAPPGNLPALQVAMPTTQALAGDLPTQRARCPWGLPQVAEQPIGGLRAHVQGLHDGQSMLQARLDALTQANLDSQVPGLLETTFKFYLNITPQGDITGGNPHMLLFLRVTLVSDPNVFVDTEPFLLEAKKDWPKNGDPPKENVGSNKRPPPSSTGSGKRQKGAGLSAGAGPSSLGAAGASSALPSDAEAGPSDAEAAEAAEYMAQVELLLQQLPPPAVQAPGDQGDEAVALLQQNPALDLQIGGPMADGAQAPLPDLVQSMVPHLMNYDDDDFVVGDFDQEPLEGSYSQGQPPSPPDDGDGGGAGYGDLGAGGDDGAPNFQDCGADGGADSAPSFTSCSAPEGAGGVYRSLRTTSGDDASGEAGLESRQSAMRRIRRAMRSTAKARLLAILQAAGAQQQQQPGATPLAQLREELEDLKAWLGL